MQWNFRCGARNGLAIECGNRREGSEPAPSSLYKDRLLGSFEVVNNSLASASLLIRGRGWGRRAIRN